MELMSKTAAEVGGTGRPGSLGLYLAFFGVFEVCRGLGRCGCTGRQGCLGGGEGSCSSSSSRLS
jgi:hypothetical protein